MRRSTTFAGTERPLLGLLLILELSLAVAFVVRSAPSAPVAVPVPTPTTSAVASSTSATADGRTVELINLGGPATRPLLDRVSAAMGDAVAAVTAFWGADWPRGIVVVATASDEQFRAMAGGGSDIAAATTGQRIVFAPGAVGLSDSALRIVLRHELFHYAARARTAADAPRWLTEGVADFVGRPDAPRPGVTRAADIARLPTDADLDTEGATRTLAYDRAWWFARFVTDRYGTATLRSLYERACGHRHPDIETAVSETLGANLDEVLAQWRTWLEG
ncbi:DUF4157 domain-containing protein [Mycobacterium sp. ITM-2016-00318]|uniref:eCIS core domain-containing protein n=1 Tax=Mycobacterium sp. ITM-2016-00318 TaxID=2099693 RepID=UPI000CFA6990|nr:DUF4157 domain-containing protein [Mycobacterium sp. ITM-2016-00318]WNG91048.1 DUF4157 domain-containing protein [Mycobacterium sp. ITM-2016-00318]